MDRLFQRYDRPDEIIEGEELPQVIKDIINPKDMPKIKYAGFVKDLDREMSKKIKTKLPEVRISLAPSLSIPKLTKPNPLRQSSKIKSTINKDIKRINSKELNPIISRSTLTSGRRNLSTTMSRPTVSKPSFAFPKAPLSKSSLQNYKIPKQSIPNQRSQKFNRTTLKWLKKGKKVQKASALNKSKFNKTSTSPIIMLKKARKYQESDYAKLKEEIK
mmetsp:Transcript_4964/g.4213  ORF Transcript_4964/g.4213 Transcript_4964/m.4213 type:complete len:217 (+) Transcript_4964:3-653(+)